MTAITCIAIAAFPKMIALGCITISVFAYNRLAKMSEHTNCDLTYTIIYQKIIKNLSAPKLNKDVLIFLKGKFPQNIENLRQIIMYLSCLEESTLKKIIGKMYRNFKKSKFI